MDVILYADMMDLLDSGQPFECVFVKADRRRGTGGELVHVKNWVKFDKDIPDAAYTSMPEGGGAHKAPNHHLHKTRNIMNLQNRHNVRKLHTRLICTFNGKQVI